MAPTADLTAVLLIAHGSRHAPANDDLHQLAARVMEGGEHSIVEPCFLELAEPDILDGGGRCVAQGATRVLMIPYFLSAGVHLLRDLTAARDALRQAHPGVEFRLGPALGPDPLLEQLVAKRIARLDSDDEAPAFASSDDLAKLYEPMGHHGVPEAPAIMASLDTNRPKD
ncbi:CbiX/SirB N-terminal domain-containing protein [Singulisphaera sp. Ch08]|uniref:CbiX/SirB N-terminal domain-containing protein n=1 Tax=Singulisphaera sp. Ch08 TaxID=3120278 RepID=A0AAU7CA89_9BACT